LITKANGELYIMKKVSWTTTKEQQRQKLEQLLRDEYGLSRRQIIRLKKQPGSVLLNEQPVRMGTYLCEGDKVDVTMEEHLEPIPPEPIPLDIIYEDQDLSIINKPAGMVSHPTKGYTSGTLANALSYHWEQKGIFRPVRLVTRLDRETSGLVLVANTAWAHFRLSQTEVYKEYLAITRGIPDPPEGKIDQPLGRSKGNPSKRGIDPLGKPALTNYKLEWTNKDLSLIRLWLITGRTHQLRIHMAHIGCPLLDDFMYGKDEGLVGRTALHSHKLEFNHPQGGRLMQFSAPLPGDMAKVASRFPSSM
jgi:23S rRNA pseudouridine1911/1915/1917 synthase